MKRGIGLLGFALEVASSFITALEFFDSMKDPAKVILAVSNYCKWPLMVVGNEAIHGKIASQMASVTPGTKGGLTASEKSDVFSTDGTEGYSAWTMNSRSFCVIYWKVGYADLPNALAVGCRPYEGTTVDDWERTIQKVKSDPDSYESPYLEYHTYDTSHRPIQFCNSYICVQGILFSASQGKATVEIFPLNAMNVAPSLQDRLTQDIIDQTTTIDNKFGSVENRKRPDGLNYAAVIGISVGATVFFVFLVCSISCCCLYHKKNKKRKRREEEEERRKEEEERRRKEEEERRRNSGCSIL